MARKVILDVDPGIDDAVAMCAALFDPSLEVVAITAVGGSVPPDQATRNVQAIIEQLDPPRLPRIGVADWPENDLPTDNRMLYGPDGLGNANFDVAELHHQHPSEKVISDEVRAAPDEVSIVALGPLTNIAKAFRRDPALATMVGQLIVLGGAVTAPGNASPVAEFNMFCDPSAAREVFRAATTKTLIPLDVTTQVVLSYDLLDQIPDESTNAGRFLHRVLPFVFRSYRERMGVEGIFLHEAVALAALSHPELFTTQEMGGDVECSGELTSGVTVFDRRLNPWWRPNMDVAITVDAAAVKDYIIRSLQAAGRAG